MTILALVGIGFLIAAYLWIGVYIAWQVSEEVKMPKTGAGRAALRLILLIFWFVFVIIGLTVTFGRWLVS